MNDQSVTSKSMDQMSMDGIQTKREIMRLKYEIDSLEKFIASANTFDKDATTKLSIPFSSMTFADYFKTNSTKYDQSHPASSVEALTESPQDIAKNKLESEKRLATLRAYNDITPSGYPVMGKITRANQYINGLGVALFCPIGTPVHATASGKIYQIKSVGKGCSIIEILHKDEKNKTVKTIYYYCYRPVIKIGQQVKKGQLIAYSGIHPATGDNVACYQVNINSLLIQPK
jgi:murein DD-endopeptidase MepM/ murein hydrolase activator NlpD